jgi:FtsZ-interacting cell division protein YlmF
MASGNPLRKIVDWFNAQDIVDEEFDDTEPTSPQASPDQTQKRQRHLTLRGSSEGGMEIRHPRNLDDRMAIGMDLKHRRMVTLDLTHLPDADARFFLEFIYGVVFALDATAEKVTDGIYLLAPRGISVRNDTEETPGEPTRTAGRAGRSSRGDVQEELFWQS